MELINFVTNLQGTSPFSSHKPFRATKQERREGIFSLFAHGSALIGGNGPLLFDHSNLIKMKNTLWPFNFDLSVCLNLFLSKLHFLLEKM